MDSKMSYKTFSMLVKDVIRINIELIDPETLGAAAKKVTMAPAKTDIVSKKFPIETDEPEITYKVSEEKDSEGYGWKIAYINSETNQIAD